MIISWDVETRGLFGSIFKLATFDGKNTKFFDTVDDFFNFLDEINKTGNEIYLYAHYHSFDINKVLQDRKKKKDVLKVNFDKSIFGKNKSKPTQIVFKRWENIYFRDSHHLFKGSLEDICKSFECETKKLDIKKEIKKRGYKNKDEFFKKVHKNDKFLLNYIRNDVESLYEVLTKFQSIVGVETRKMVTIASVAMNVFKTQFREDFNKIVKINNKKYSKEAIDLIRKSYKGGRVEVIKPEGKNIFGYDVNSLYPDVMSENEYTTGYYYLHEGVAAHSRFLQLLEDKDKLATVEVTVFIPQHKICPLPTKINDKLMFVWGEVRDVWNTPELFYAIEKYNVKVLQVHKMIEWQEKCRPFKRFVEKFTKIKTEKTGAQKQTAKLIQNSLYGKFGMREEVEKFIYVDDFKKLDKQKQDKILQKKKRIEENFYGGDVIVYEGKIFADYIHPHISSFITSYARLVLLKKIKELEEKRYKIYYFDTDSIYTDCPPEEFEKLHEKKRGYWKLENEIEEAIFAAPKAYCIKIKEKEKTKMKGIPKEKEKEKTKMKGIPKEKMLHFDQMKELLNQDNFSSYTTTLERLPTLWKQLKSNDDLEYELMRKSIIFFDEKRKPNGRYESHAWNIKEVLKANIEKDFDTNKDGSLGSPIITINGKEIRSFEEFKAAVKEIEKEVGIQKPI